MQYDIDPLANGQDLTGVSIHAGFPNPAADRFGQRSSGLALDLNQLLIRHPSSTYLFRIDGEQWAGQGIFDGDIAIIDRVLHAVPQDIVLIWLDDVFELRRRHAVSNDHQVWGVVQAIIHPRSHS